MPQNVRNYNKSTKLKIQNLKTTRSQYKTNFQLFFIQKIEASNGKTITWSSSKTDIATIITVSDGEKNASYTLNVNGMLGDSDNDTQITSYDSYRALFLSVNQGIEIQNDEDEVVSLDVDRDEEITSWDAYRILIFSIGTISEF